jgi:NAD(P)-dependent dehydrogenase (short-subunit alcohol dehydrogenase family)
MAGASSTSEPRRARWTRQDTVLFIAFLAVMWWPVRRFFAGGVAAPSLLRINLSDRTFIVTGGNTGIGFETSRQLACQNGTVVIASRDVKRGADAVRRILSICPHAHVESATLDLASLDSVRAFATNFKNKHTQLHGLINNAGVMVPPFSRTQEGFELQFGTNHLGHFLLTNLLLDTLAASAPSRIVAVSSMAHDAAAAEWDWEDVAQWRNNASYGIGWQAYGNSKLANILHAQELARRLQGTGVTAVSLHPGAVRTELQRHMLPEWVSNILMAPITYTGLKSPWEGAQTTLHAVLSSDVPAQSGAYLSDCAVKPVTHPVYLNAAAARRLWQLSEQLVAGK